MKNNSRIIAVIVVVVLLLVGVWFFVLRKNTAQNTLPSQNQNLNIKRMTPEDIGLTLSLRSDKRAVEMEITKLTGIKSIEYEVSYDAEVTDEGETVNVPKGVVSSPIEIDPSDATIKKEILLGTCSASVCKYDIVTSEIKFVIKVNLANGEIGSIETSIPFE